MISLAPYDANKFICKRITGIAGDMVRIKSDNYPFNQVTIVPRGHVWLTGDNSEKSLDSREYGEYTSNDKAFN